VSEIDMIKKKKYIYKQNGIIFIMILEDRTKKVEEWF